VDARTANVSLRSPTGSSSVHLSRDFHSLPLPVGSITRSFPSGIYFERLPLSPELTTQVRMITTMPTRGAYPRDDTATTILWDNGQAAPTVTVTVDSGYGRTPRKKVAGDSGSLAPGVIGAIVVVSVLVVICLVTAAALHRSWCMRPECTACLILRCGRRKPQTGTKNTPLALDRISTRDKVGSGMGGYQISQHFPAEPLTSLLIHLGRKAVSIFSIAPRWIGNSVRRAQVAQHW